MDKKKILVVDDEIELVKVLEIRLRKEGFEVVTAADGEDALKKARKEKPDLLILDLMLPKIDGYKVCRLLKFDQKYKNIPIIMLTARVEEHDRNLGMEMGADEYITKPFEWDKLLEKILGFLPKQGKEEEA